MQSVTLKSPAFPTLEITTLEGDLINEYEATLNTYKEPARSVLNILDRREELRGSNGFSPIILRNFTNLRSRLPTIVDLMEALKIDQRFLKGSYTDLGLVLRTAGDSDKNNDLVAKDLASQFNNRGIGLKAPLIIYFDALDLRENKDSFYGLSYVLSDRAELGKNFIQAPEIFSAIEFEQAIRFERVNEKGIPIPDEIGTKYFYVRNDGLSRLSWGVVKDLNSDVGNLSRSTTFGRTLVVREKRAA